jgi:hypothetical protein
MAQDKPNHRGAKISGKNLTMENQSYFQKHHVLEERNGVYHGGKKENQG